MNRARTGAALLLLISTALPGQKTSGTEDSVRALYDSGHWAEAANLAAKTAHPSPVLLYYEGLSLARLKSFGQARQIFQRGEKLYRNDKRFPIELAGIAYRERDVRGAKRYLQHALTLAPDNRYTRDFLATLFLLDGNLPAALKYWHPIDKPIIEGVRFEPTPPLDAVLRERTFDISGGQMFTRERLRGTEANLFRLHIFYETRFDLIPVQQTNRFDLQIHSVPLSEAPGGWIGRILPALRELPYAGLSFDFLNVRDEAKNLESLLRWDPNKERIALHWSQPWRKNPRIQSNYFADLRHEKWYLPLAIYGGPGAGSVKDILVRKAALGTEIAVGLTDKLQWTLGGLLSYRDITEAPRTATFSSGWTVQLRNRFDYLNWEWPDRRVTIKDWGSFDVGRLFTNNASRLITIRGGLVSTWFPQAKGDTYRLTEQIQSGRAYGGVPLDDLFSLGMERDNEYDLWLRGIVATSSGRKGSAPLGREYWISQTDFERKIIQIPFVRFDGGTFFDSGWVGDPSRDFGSHEVVYDVGVEMKIRTLGGVTVRLVYGRDLMNGRGAFYTAVSR